jgi:putative aldouronate transport system permease protein
MIAATKQTIRRTGFLSARFRREIPLYIMILPTATLLVVFAYGPMGGILMAFEKYLPGLGILRSKWVGLANFKYLLDYPGIFSVLWNTLFIAVMKIAVGLVVPVTFALLLNEVRSKFTKRSIQTLVYLPYFLSWVILSGILVDILSPGKGIVNKALGLFCIKPVYFLGDKVIFPYAMVFTDLWKNFGFGTIVYLAALTGIDPELYEASIVDGAGRWKQTIHVTLPGIVPIVALMTVLSLGNILNAGFEQIFNLYSIQVYDTGDIIDTLVYRMGMLNYQYGVATAMGLFKSLVSAGLIVLSYWLAGRVAHYRIF